MKTKLWRSLLTLTSVVISIQPAILQANAQTYQPTNRAPVADNTLGTQVSGDGNNFNITGGVNKGQTVFHSFTDFSVPTNGQANFTNPVGNRDIITRVTGNLFSDINGTVNSNGANFFLINPNGIVFGTNARLNVGKAFVGSTANSIDLVDAGGRAITFGTNPNGDAPLLSVAPNVLFDVSRLNIGGGNGAISSFATLNYSLGQYIGLIGGKVAINGGQISTPSGRVELGGLSAPGSIELTTAGNIPKLNFSVSAPGGFEITTEGKIPKLNFPANVPRSDVSITKGAVIDTIGIGGGDIFVTARNLEILSSSLNAGIIVGLGSTTVAGDIKLDATGTMLINGSSITNQVQSTADGKGGNITINANSLSVSNASLISNDTFGRGNAGNVTIAVTDAIDLSDKSFIFSNIREGAVGNGGKIEIESGSLSLRDGSLLNTITSGKGDAGKIVVDIKGNLSLNNRSSINSFIEPQAEGKSQGISIVAKNINLSNSGIISSNFGGIGNAGNIDIKTTGDLTIDGKERSVLTTDLSGSFISSGTSGKGDAGKITIEAGGILSLNNNAIIDAQIFEKGEGNSQGIAINAKDLSLSNFSSIFTDNFGGIGNAGNIDIKTTGDITIVGSDRSIPLVNGVDTINIRNSSSISSSSRGRKGDTGKITIDTQGNISLNNRASIRSGLVSAEGNSQGISISTKNLRVINNSSISTTNERSIGNAGNIDIKTTGDIEIAGLTDLSLSNQQGSNFSGITTINTNGRGNSGNIKIESQGNIDFSNAFISSFSGSEGQAANISISSQKLNLSNRSIIATSGFSVGGGNITLAISDLLLLRNNSLITSGSFSAGEDGNGGNITISSPLIVALPGNNDITANAIQGSGGNVQITSQGLFGIQFRPTGSEFTNDITASSTFGQNGTVNITTPGTDPGRDSTELPNTTTDASTQISQACSANNRQNKLIVAGRGGIPPNANDPLTSDLVWQDARAVSLQPAVSSTTNNLGKRVPPAVGWVFDGKGKVTLVAAATPGQPTGTSVACPQGVGK
jgi:filamentous hemagglutinin family protein